MNLRNNKGMTGIDISISIIIILLFIPTTFGIVYNIQKNNNAIVSESVALKIATDILETAKVLNYQDVSLTANSLFVTQLSNRYRLVNLAGGEFSYTGEKNEQYKIILNIENYVPTGREEFDFVKKLKVTINYPVGNKNKTVEISTVVKNT